MMIQKFRWSTLPVGLAIFLVFAGLWFIFFMPWVLTLLIFKPGMRINFFELFVMWIPGKTAVTQRSPELFIPATIFFLIIFTASCVVGVLLVRRANNPQYKRGFANPVDVVNELGEEQLVKKRGPHLRPSLQGKEISPEQVGYPVGVYRKIKTWLRSEDPTIIVGPSRSGKGWYLILNWILSAPGAVVTTSSKMDNLLMTAAVREVKTGGKSWLFAPGIPGSEGYEQQVRWDPVAGCVDEETLIRRVKALIPSDAFSGSTSNGGHWDTLGQQLSAHLFHAAACGGFGVDKIWDWVGSPQRAFDAVRLIREHPEGLLEHANHLESVLTSPQEQRANQWGVLPTSLAFLESRIARKWMSPETEEDNFNPIGFVLRKETLYLVGDKQTTSGYVRIIDGLLAEIDYVTKGLADASPNGRLDPPVTYLLDEAGNFEYQGLYELITAGGGRGRVAVAVFQSKEQLGQYGQENLETLWDAAVAKIILPGGANDKELQAISNLIGSEWTVREQYSYGQGGRSVSLNRERETTLEPHEIRQLKPGTGLLFYRQLKPVLCTLQPFNKNDLYPKCVEANKKAVQKIQKESIWSEHLKTSN